MLLLGTWDVRLYEPQISLGLLREEIPYLCPKVSLRMQRRLGSLCTQRQTQEEMNIKVIKKVILVLMVLVVVAAVVSLPFLNEAQRMIVGMGAGLGLVNLLGLLFFLSKNSKPTKP